MAQAARARPRPLSIRRRARVRPVITASARPRTRMRIFYTQHLMLSNVVYFEILEMLLKYAFKRKKSVTGCIVQRGRFTTENQRLFKIQLMNNISFSVQWS